MSSAEGATPPSPAPLLLPTPCPAGTTWMQQVLSLIVCEGNLWPIYHLPNWSRMPWIEQVSFSKLLPELRSSWPRMFTSHLSAEVLAPALMKSKAKVGDRCLHVPQRLRKSQGGVRLWGSKASRGFSSPSSPGVKDMECRRVESASDRMLD